MSFPKNIDPSHQISEDEKIVYEFLDESQVNYSVFFHSPAYSMEECEKIRKKINAPIFKNLFLTNKQQSVFFLLMLPADKPFKTKYLSSQLNCSRLSFASSEYLKDLLHIEPGAVSPLGLIHDKENKVQLIVDKDLADTEIYACHPCVNTASVVISLNDLLNKVISKTDHSYKWVNLPSE